MSWTVPATYSTGQVLTAANLNTYLRDNMNAVGGLDKAYVRVYNSAVQSVGTSSITAITFDSEREDTQNIHSTVTNTGRLTIPAAWDGMWLFGGQILWAGNATGVRAIWLRINGGTDLVGAVFPNSAAAQNDGGEVTTFNRFVAGDYVEVTVWQNSGGNLNTFASPGKSPEFWATWMGK